MLIEIRAPASLTLGLLQVESEARVRTCRMGVTLQYPPVRLSAQSYRGGLKITGARAHVAHVQAERFLKHHRLEAQAEVEIELAIPNFMGLDSDAMLGLAVARALAWLQGLPLDDTPALARALGLGPQDALAVWGFHQGGFLVVDAGPPAASGDMPPMIRRQKIAHQDKDAWVFVFHFPRTAQGTPETLEADRWVRQLNAAPHLSLETGRLLDEELWPALEKDDIVSFARALMAIQRLNQEALARAGSPFSLTPEAQAILDIMRDHGALAWGQTPTGLGLYGLIQGATASIEMREKLSDHVGIYGGRVMAAIADNRGAHHVIREESLDDDKLKPIKQMPS